MSEGTESESVQKIAPEESATGGIRVRQGYPRDIPVLIDFNRALAAETERKDLDPARLGEGVAAVFADPTRGSYFVAEREGQAVGCLMVTHEWSDWRNGVFWWIQSVYVVPAARKEGVFRALYDSVLRRAGAAREVCGIRLYVDRENESAQKVYDSVGMQRSHYRLYEVDFVLGSNAGGP